MRETTNYKDRLRRAANPSSSGLNKIHAWAEAVAFEDGTLKKISNKNAHGRREKFRDIFFTVTCWSFYVLSLYALAISFSWIFHLVVPECLHYLSDEQFDKVEHLVFTGATASLISLVVLARKTFLDSPNDDKS